MKPDTHRNKSMVTRQLPSLIWVIKCNEKPYQMISNYTPS